jgi:hypothetical protein
VDAQVPHTVAHAGPGPEAPADRVVGAGAAGVRLAAGAPKVDPDPVEAPGVDANWGADLLALAKNQLRLS